MKKNYYISIAGVMGSGKTTASEVLAEEFGYRLFKEAVEDNMFLPKFYEDPKRWAFGAQFFYLQKKGLQLQKIKDLLLHNGIVQDVPILQDHHTYAKAQHVLGYMSDMEFALYEAHVHHVSQNLPAPDLIVHLEASPQTLMQRIQKRARGYEQKVSLSYLELLSQLQHAWINNHPEKKILVVRTDDLDIVKNKNDKTEFISKVRSRLD